MVGISFVFFSASSNLKKRQKKEKHDREMNSQNQKG